ncbi:senecionine N-oxygenase-like [Musca vetustissima]|uniref:senecionine N-oxygenase-like n=1 Tax=Musca vetustissima TaxID=27455 RepID=UPI002AB67C05|nr:senecionine N-oxygenase-like [Musca vetustissima]
MKRIAVVGAGTAGLCAARRALENGYSVTIYEQNNEIGGTWVYTDQVGTNEYGIEVHSSMYQGLRTNLPKEVMGYPDFQIDGYDESYVPSKAIENFLGAFCAKYQLEKYIRFLHYVIRIMPKDNRWEVVVKNLKTGSVDFEMFDYVMICNGHYHTPLYPTIKGLETYQGQQIHSHDYKNAERFRDQSVLIIGAGPSGMDLCHEISKVAERVTLSHHMPETPKTQFRPNVNQKPDVAYTKGSTVVFTNGEEEKYTIIFYCTGYKYAFPFLSTNCGIYVDDNWVRPLYKHCINIEYPTMSFIGIPYYVCAAQMMDLQSRFTMEFWKGRKELPSREEMLQDTEQEMERRFAKGYKKRQAHMMGEEQIHYYNDLAKTAAIENIKPVMTYLHNESSRRFLDDLLHFREDVFRIVDNESFVKIN